MRKVCLLLSCTIANAGRCMKEITARIATAKTALSKNKKLIIGRQNVSLGKTIEESCLRPCTVWNGDMDHWMKQDKLSGKLRNVVLDNMENEHYMSFRWININVINEIVLENIVEKSKMY